MTELVAAPYFSIIIPAYNRSEVIGAALDSCIEQTFSDFEVIVVDDGSNDGVALRNTVEAYEDSRIRLIVQNNGGAAAARNTGIRAAKGLMIAFLDTDDRFLPAKLETFRKLIGDRERFAGFAPAYVDRGERHQIVRPFEPYLPGTDLGEYFFSRNHLIQTSMLVVDRATAEQVLFDTGIKVGEDTDFCLAVEASGLQWEMIAEPLSIWFDEPREGRSSEFRGSAGQGYKDYRTWQLLSRKARKGYEGTIVAFHTAPHNKLRALRLMIEGSLKGGVPIKVTARQFLRAYVPRRQYHRLVSIVLKMRS